MLWQFTNLWQHQIRAALAPLGITHVQFVLLAGMTWLETSERLLTQALLSHHARTDTMMTSQVVRTLEQKGLCRRTLHPTDGRARVVSLTTEGRSIAQHALSVVERTDEQFFAELAGQTAAFVGLMQRLIGARAEARGSIEDT